MNPRRGIALLLCLGVLAVLSILSVSFVRLTSQERLGSNNYAAQVRAEMLATAGVVRAMSEISSSAFLKPYTDLKSDRWVFRSDDGKDVGYWPATTLEAARYPSLPYDRNENGVFENGVGALSGADLVHGRAVSGAIDDVSKPAQSAFGLPAGANYGASFETLGNTFVLKIRDATSKINVNGTQANLVVLLDTLGKAIATDVSFFDPIAGRGAEIVAFRKARAGGRLLEIAELRPLLGVKAVRLLEDFLTCHAWQDKATIEPDPQVDPRKMPARAFEPRSPVNINTAAKPVLRALLVGLSGYELQFVETDEVYLGHATVVDEKKATPAISFERAGFIADEIISERLMDSFKTWDQFKAFVLSLPLRRPELSSMTPGQLDCIRANFNPNTLLVRFNPNLVRAHRVSKLDLIRYSTEFCFGSGGTFEIECLGLVTAQGGQVMARARRFAVVKLYETLRHTTQDEFERNRVKSHHTVSYPESMADLRDSKAAPKDGSPWDGQIEMFLPPKKDGVFSALFIDSFKAERAGGGKLPGWDTDAKEEDRSLFEGSDLLPDGMLCSRALAEELHYTTSGNIPTKAGALEFWIKLVGDGKTGSNESLLYMVNVNKTAPLEGVANKLIRFGNKLINTRFYWGFPHNAVSPYPLCFSESKFDISGWKAHEWHHIAIVWEDAVRQRFYVDGKRSTTTFELTSAENRFVLASNNPLDETAIGGYEFVSEKESILYHGPIVVKGRNDRFTNATISGFRAYADAGGFTGSSFPMPDRFEAHPLKPSQWHGRFRLDDIPRGATIGSISWTEYQPRMWRTASFNADPSAPDTDVRVEYLVDSGSWTRVPTDPALGGDGRGYAIDRVIGSAKGSGRYLEYRLTFTNPGGISPFTVTPVIDDITITYQTQPQILVWR